MSVQLSQVLSLISSIFVFAWLATYIYRLTQNASIPNPSTWLIWTFITLINSLTYLEVVQNDFMRTAPCFASLMGVLIVVFYSLKKGKFSKVNRVDLICFILAVALGAFWQTTGDPETANVMLQFVLLNSCVRMLNRIMVFSNR